MVCQARCPQPPPLPAVVWWDLSCRPPLTANAPGSQLCPRDFSSMQGACSAHMSRRGSVRGWCPCSNQHHCEQELVGKGPSPRFWATTLFHFCMAPLAGLSLPRTAAISSIKHQLLGLLPSLSLLFSLAPWNHLPSKLLEPMSLS